MATSPRIEELRKKFDENPRRYFAPLANEYRKVGDFEQAIFICQEYLPQQPGHMSGHIVFGQALFEAKRLPEAKTVFETALTLDPENLIALRNLADISRELGDITAAKTWYERVLQADPRNEEIAGIMAKMSGSTPPAASPGASPAAAPSAPSPRPAAGPGSPSAPTTELSAAAVQELVNARKAAKAQTEAPAAPVQAETLDDAMTIELTPPPVAAALEGLEPTSHSAPVEGPTHSILDAPSPVPTADGIETSSILDPAPTTPEMMDLPAGGMLGLEPTSVAPVPDTPPAAPSASPTLDEFAIEDLTMPAAQSTTAPAPQPSAATEDGLLDLDPIELDLPAHPIPSGSPAAVAAAEAPIDGGHDGLMDLEIDLPGAAPSPAQATPAESMPTIVMEAIKGAGPAVKDMIEETLPTIVDAVKEVVPAVVGAAASMPTIIMDAITMPREAAKEPEGAPTQQIDVKGVMADIDAKRNVPPENAIPESTPAAFVTETMAQLYLEQGHREKALEIYRQLVASKPHDAELAKRLEAIERASVAGTSSPPAAVTPVPAPDAGETLAAAVPPPKVGRFMSTGPTIRAVLRDLMGVDASATHLNGNGAAAGATGERGSIDTLFASNADEEVSSLAAAFDGGYVAAPGSIDAVFGG